MHIYIVSSVCSRHIFNCRGGGAGSPYKEIFGWVAVAASLQALWIARNSWSVPVFFCTIEMCCVYFTLTLLQVQLVVGRVGRKHCQCLIYICHICWVNHTLWWPHYHAGLTQPLRPVLFTTANRAGDFGDERLINNHCSKYATVE